MICHFNQTSPRRASGGGKNFSTMKEGDKIIFPEVTEEQLVEIGIRHYDYQRSVLRLCGQTVTVCEVNKTLKWDNFSPGYFRIEKYGFSYPLEWIEK